MKLKPKERAELMAGKFPELVRPHAEFKVGEEIVLSTTRIESGTIPEVSIRILGRHKTKNGAWQPDYVVTDTRGLYVNQGLGYTRSAARALDREAPILDPAVIEQYAAEAEQRTALLGAERSNEETVGRLEAKLDEAKRLNKWGRVRILETRISRKIGPPDMAQF